MSKAHHPSRPPKKRKNTQNKNAPERTRPARADLREKEGPIPKGPPWLFGRHAVIAALQNQARHCHRLIATSEFLNSHGEELNAASRATSRKRPDVEIQDRRYLDELLQGAVHQGVALQVDPLARCSLEDVLSQFAEHSDTLLVALDQATDPQNIGAVLRSCAAFGAKGVIMPDKNAPEVSGAMAKTACGALERIPLVRVTNLSRSLDQLKEDGFWTVGLDGYADTLLGDVDLKGKIVLVMGSEGTGLRRLTREKCDYLAKIPITQAVESLNLSNATAVALYEATRQRPS